MGLAVVSTTLYCDDVLPRLVTWTFIGEKFLYKKGNMYTYVLA